jgi:cold shock CspA family protein
MASWIDGKVRYFDKKRGTGIIEDPQGRLWDIHYSAIDCDKDWRTLEVDKKVKFKAVVDPDFFQVLKCKEV